MEQSDHVVCLVHNEDATQWSKYISEHLRELRPNSKDVVILDTDLIGAASETHAGLKARSSLANASVVVVIISPGHLSLLDQSAESELNYATLMPKSTFGVLLRLGVEDDEVISVGQFAVSGRWRKESYDDLDGFWNTVEKELESPVKRRMQFSLLPTRTHCEEPTTVVLSFTNKLADQDADTQVEVVLTECDGQTTTLPCQWLNPYTVSFTAPEHKEGHVTINVTVDGDEVGSEQLEYYTTATRLIDVSQIYIHQLSRLASFVLSKRISVDELDRQLSGAFDVIDQVPAQAFELLFGVHQHIAENSYNTELPTLIHMAAKFGLQELCSKLVDLPDAQCVCGVVNRDNKLPEDLALTGGHPQLATFLRNYRELSSDIDAVHEEYVSYVHMSAVDKTQSRLSEAHYLPMNKKSSESKPSESSYMNFAGPTATATRLSAVSPSAAAGASLALTARPPRMSCSAPSPAVSAAHSSAASVAQQPARRDMSQPQLQLVEMMELVKRGEMTMDEMEAMFSAWQMKYKNASNKSFKDKQEQMTRMRDELSRTRKPGTKQTPTVEKLVTAQQKRESVSQIMSKRQLPPLPDDSENSKQRTERDSGFSDRTSLQDEPPSMPVRPGVSNRQQKPTTGPPLPARK